MLVKWGDPFLAKHTDYIEMVQPRVERSINKLRGREGATSEKESFGLELLQNRRKDAKIKLEPKILSSDTNSPLADNFNNIHSLENYFQFSCDQVCDII